MSDCSFEVIDGIKCYAPEIAVTNDFFPAESFERLYQIESENFWFRARNRIIQYLTQKYLGSETACSFLEIGCGTGYVLKGLFSKFGNLRLSGAEIHIAGLKYAKKRLPQADFFQIDATRIPFQEQYDAIGAFDVLEHIEQDRLAVQNIHGALKPGGLFFVSVPQHEFLWSSVDVHAHHKRRYSRKGMIEVLKTQGFEIEFVSSFVFSLLPVMYATRLLRRGQKTSEEGKKAAIQEFSPSKLVNSFLGLLMNFDELLIRLGFSLPAGGSLIVVARKPR